ncbi:MAG: MutS-related protein, partial [Polyangiaceae bacterium]
MIVASITSGREAYRLSPFFEMPLKTLEAINYRQEVFRDLENRALQLHLASFAEAMRTVRSCVEQSEARYCRLEKERWFLDAMTRYCEGAVRLADDFGEAPLKSTGLMAFRDYLGGYEGSDAFKSLRDEARRIADELAAIRYSVHIEGDRIEVRRYSSEPDYSHEVALTFEKFEQGAVREYSFRFHHYAGMNHVDEAILDRVAQLFPQPFSALSEFCMRHR